MKDTVQKTVTIANGAKVSDALALPHQFSLGGLIYPAMTTSTAFNFEVSLGGTTFTNLYGSDGNVYAVTIPAATAGAVTLDPNIFSPWEYVKVKVADNQTGAKSIQCAITTEQTY